MVSFLFGCLSWGVVLLAGFFLVFGLFFRRVVRLGIEGFFGVFVVWLFLFVSVRFFRI